MVYRPSRPTDTSELGVDVVGDSAVFGEDCTQLMLAAGVGVGLGGVRKRDSGADADAAISDRSLGLSDRRPSRVIARSKCQKDYRSPCRKRHAIIIY